MPLQPEDIHEQMDDYAKESYRAGFKHAQEQAAAIVMQARLGEIDTDFRSILHRINGLKSKV